MMHWLRHMLGRNAKRKEKAAQVAETNVVSMEKEAVVQEERLKAATKRVSNAIAQVRRVEDLAKRKGPA